MDTIDADHTHMLRWELLFALMPLCFSRQPPPRFQRMEVHGHRVYVSPEAVSGGDLLDRLLGKLDADLGKAERALPATALKKIATVPFWIERDDPKVPNLAFFPRGGWLSKLDYDRDKAGCIEIGNLSFLVWHDEQPFLVLHELSHAYQDRVLGQNNRVLRRAFQMAASSHKYESVSYILGGRRRAYALENAAEYFAELSESYFGENDFYPFTRNELKEFDPGGFEMIESLWKVRH